MLRHTRPNRSVPVASTSASECCARSTYLKGCRRPTESVPLCHTFDMATTKTRLIWIWDRSPREHRGGRARKRSTCVARPKRFDQAVGEQPIQVRLDPSQLVPSQHRSETRLDVSDRGEIPPPSFRRDPPPHTAHEQHGLPAQA